MPDILIDGKLKSVDESSQLFIVKDGKNIGYEEGDQPLITDIEQLDIKVKESGFKDVRVTRLDNLYVNYIELEYDRNGETRIGVPGQYLGDPLNLNGVRLKVYYLSDSGVNFSKKYNVSVGKYKLCYRRGDEYIECEDQTNVTESSKYIKYSFTYNSSTISSVYDLFSIKKFLSAEVESGSWDTAQYTDTAIDTSGLKLRLCFQSLDGDTGDVTSEYKTIDFSKEEVDYITCDLKHLGESEDKWASTGTKQDVEITCRYLNDDEYDFDETVISFTYRKDGIIIKCIDSILGCTLKRQHEGEKQYFLDAPDLKCDYLKVHYNNGDTKELTATQRNKVSLYVPFTSKLHESSSGLTRYVLNSDNSFSETTDTTLTSGYTKKWHTVANTLLATETVVVSYAEEDANNNNHYVVLNYSESYVILAHIESIAINEEDSIPKQYENTSFNTGIQSFYEVTYNNNLKIKNYIKDVTNNITIPKYSETQEYYSSNKWHYYSSELSVSIDITIKYVDSNEEEIQLNTPITLYKKVVQRISNKDPEPIYEVDANSDVDLNSLEIVLNYNNGEHEVTHPTAVKKQNTETETETVISKYDTFSDETGLDTLKINVDYYLSYDSYSVPKTFFLKRNYSSVQALKSDNTNFEFGKEEHFRGKEIKLDSLDRFVINFSDGSKYVISFEEDTSKILTLSNKGVTLSISSGYWGQSKEQTIYFIFKKVNYEATTDIQTVTFNILLKSFTLSLKNNVKLYQGKSIEDSLKNDFQYNLEVWNDSHTDTETWTNVSFDELGPKFNAKIYCSSYELGLWPIGDILSEKSAPSFSRDNVIFNCVSLTSAEEFNLDKTVTLSFYRVVSDLEIKDFSGTYVHTYNTPKDYKIKKGGDIKYSEYELGVSQKVTFTNGYSYELGESQIKNFLKKFIIEDGLTKDIEIWPENGEFYITYDELDNNLRSTSTIIKGTNVLSFVDKIEVSQKENTIISGTVISFEHLDIKLIGLLKEEVEITDAIKEHLTIENGESTPFDTSRKITVTYENSDFEEENNTRSAECTIKLTQESRSLEYEIYVNGYEDKMPSSYYTLVCDRTYTPSHNETVFDFAVIPSDAADNTSIYSFSELMAYDKDTGELFVNKVNYDPVKHTMTLSKELDRNLIVKIKMSTDFIMDVYGHAYSCDNDGVLTSVKSIRNLSKSIYRIPDEVKTIPSGPFVGSTELKTLIIGNNVLRIKDNAFDSCPSLTEIIFEERNKIISIGQHAFYRCSSLSTLDFRKCGDIRQCFIIGTPDSDPTSGTPVRNTWEGCKLRYIKIKRESFTDILRVYYLDNSAGSIYKWITARCAGAIRVKVKSISTGFIDRLRRSTDALDLMKTINYDQDTSSALDDMEINSLVDPKKMVFRIKSLPQLKSSLPTIDGYSGNNIYLYFGGSNDTFNLTENTYDKKSYYKVRTENGSIQDMAGSYDVSKACAVAIRSDANLNIWTICYGLGYWSDATYDNYITSDENKNNRTNFKFTTNGRVGNEYVSVEEYSVGTHFSNWDNEAYVNDCIYPNIKLSSTPPSNTDITQVLDSTDKDTKHKYNNTLFGTYLDFMIPIYQ